MADFYPSDWPTRQEARDVIDGLLGASCGAYGATLTHPQQTRDPRRYRADYEATQASRGELGPSKAEWVVVCRETAERGIAEALSAFSRLHPFEQAALMAFGYGPGARGVTPLSLFAGEGVSANDLKAASAAAARTLGNDALARLDYEHPLMREIDASVPWLSVVSLARVSHGDYRLTRLPV